MMVFEIWRKKWVEEKRVLMRRETQEMKIEEKMMLMVKTGRMGQTEWWLQMAQEMKRKMMIERMQVE